MQLKKHLKTLNLIKYILDRIGDAEYGKVLKLIYFIDFEHYSRHKKPISNKALAH